MKSIESVITHASETSRPQEERLHRRFLLLILAFVIGGLWLVPLPSSLWLDELGTAWVVEEGWRQTFSRALEFQGQTPLYFLIAWGVKRLGGESEMLLRLPSVLSLSLGAYLLYRLTSRLLDKEAAILTAIAFASLGKVSFAAADARPYAFAFTALIAATLALVRWVEAKRPTDGALWAVFSALTIYFHYLFSAALLCHVVYVGFHSRREVPPFRQIVGAIALLIALLVPAASHFRWLLEQREAFSVASDLSVRRLMDDLFPPLLVVGLVGGYLLSRLAGPIAVVSVPATDRATLPFAVAWLAGPPVLLFAFSHLLNASLFTALYPASSAPGTAIAIGWAVRSLSSARARRIAITAVAALSMVSIGGRLHGAEDWRGAIAAVNGLQPSPSTPILLHAAFIEAEDPAWLDDPLRSSYLNAPAAYYPLDGRVIAMPYDLDETGTAYLDLITEEALRGTDRFFLISRYPFVPIKEWLGARLTSGGYSSRTLGQFGIVVVTEFTRSGPSEG